MYSGLAKLHHEDDVDNDHSSSSCSGTWPNNGRTLQMLRKIGNDQPVPKPVRISVLQKRFSDNLSSYHDSRPPSLEEEDECDLDEQHSMESSSMEEGSFSDGSKMISSSTFDKDETDAILQASYTHPLSSKQRYEPFTGLSGRSTPHYSGTPLKFSRGPTAATPQFSSQSMERLVEPVIGTPRSVDLLGTKSGSYITPYKTMVMGPRPGQNEFVKSISKSSRTLVQQETLNAENLRTPFSEIRRTFQMHSTNKQMTIINHPMTGEDKENVVNCIPTEMWDMHLQTPKGKRELFNQPNKFMPGTQSGKKNIQMVSPFPTEHPKFKRPSNNALHFSERDVYSGINNWSTVEGQKQMHPYVNGEPPKSDIHLPLPNCQGTIEDEKQGLKRSVGWESQNKEFLYPDRVGIKLESNNSRSINDSKQPNHCVNREPLLYHEKLHTESQSNNLAVGQIQLNHSENKESCYSERLESKVQLNSHITCVGSESQLPAHGTLKEQSSKELYSERPDFIPKPNNYVVSEDNKYLLKNCTNRHPKELHYSVPSGESKLHSNNCVVVDDEKQLLNPSLNRKSTFADHFERSSINRQESLNHIGDQELLPHHTSNRDALELNHLEKANFIRSDSINHLIVDSQKPLQNSTSHKESAEQQYPERQGFNRPGSHNQKPLPNYMAIRESKELPISQRRDHNIPTLYNPTPLSDQNQLSNCANNNKFEKSNELHYHEKLGLNKLEPNNYLSVNIQKPLSTFTNSELQQTYPEKPSVNKSKFINCVPGNEQRPLVNSMPKSESKELYSERKSPSKLESNNLVPVTNQKMFLNPMNRELEQQNSEKLVFNRLEHNNRVAVCDQNQLPNPINRDSKGQDHFERSDPKRLESYKHVAVNNSNQLPHPTNKELKGLHSDSARSDLNVVIEQNDWASGEEQAQETPTVQWTSVVESRPVLRFKDKVFLKLSKLGVGGSSEVYRVVEQKSSKLLAVKCVDMSTTDPETALGYLNEVQLLSRLQHKDTIIKLFDHEYLKKEQRLYMIMEHGDTDLAKLIRSICLKKKVPMTTIIYYWTEMLKAVQDIHSEGIVHADLKPANFLMVCGRLKLIDFGIASSVRPDMTSTFKNTPAGTYNYMSPEVIQDPGSANPRSKIGFKSDVWSLGCILYNLLYGHTPFQHISAPFLKLSTIVNPNHSIKFSPVQGCPTVLHRALMQCLQYEPKFRPTVAELMDLPYMWCGPVDSK